VPAWQAQRENGCGRSLYDVRDWFLRVTSLVTLRAACSSTTFVKSRPNFRSSSFFWFDNRPLSLRYLPADLAVRSSELSNFFLTFARLEFSFLVSCTFRFFMGCLLFLIASNLPF